MAQVHHLIIYARTRTVVAHVGVYLIGKVEHGGTLGKLAQLARGSEHEHLVFVEVHLELVHGLQSVGILQRRADAVQPFVEPAFPFHAFVAPVGGQTAFGHFVHAFRANLHFHPFLLGAQHGDMQTLVAVRFRHRQPVAQSLGVALIHVGDDGKGLPAERHLLHAVGSRSLVFGRLDDDADGEQVVDALELAFLLLHLLPDGVYALGAPLHVELQPGLLQPLLDWRDELADVGVAAFLRGIQLFLYHVVGVMLHVFQRQVFQLALQFVESQLVGQWGI